MRIYRLAALLCLGLILSSCSRERLGPPPAGLHRRVAGTIDYSIDAAVSPEIEAGIRQAFDIWSAATPFKFEYAGRTKAGFGHDGKNKVLILKSWPPELPQTAAAWCQAYLDSEGNLVQTDILLNAQSFSFTSRAESKPGSLYIEDVLLREIGRSLGLGLGEEASDRFKAAQAADGFEPSIDPAEMASYLSLYAAD